MRLGGRAQLVLIIQQDEATGLCEIGQTTTPGLPAPWAPAYEAIP